MNNLDSTCKESKIFLDHAKDSISQRLVDVAKASNLTEEQLINLSNVVLASLDESYQKVLPYYQNSIKKFVK